MKVHEDVFACVTTIRNHLPKKMKAETSQSGFSANFIWRSIITQYSVNKIEYKSKTRILSRLAFRCADLSASIPRTRLESRGPPTKRRKPHIAQQPKNRKDNNGRNDAADHSLKRGWNTPEVCGNWNHSWLIATIAAPALLGLAAIRSIPAIPQSHASRAQRGIRTAHFLDSRMLSVSLLMCMKQTFQLLNCVQMWYKRMNKERRKGVGGQNQSSKGTPFYSYCFKFPRRGSPSLWIWN